MSKTSRVSELSEKIEKYIPVSSKYFTCQTTLVSINLIKHQTTKDDACEGHCASFFKQWIHKKSTVINQ
jgi:hypothetical protein